MFPQIFGKYVLERELAAGGMARVYLATLRGAVGFEKRLVVKQIRPELACDPAFVRRFVEEAKTTVELSHPNIVPVYELGVEQGVYYIAMELCAGITLAEMLQRSGPLSAEEGAHLGVEVCRALDYAHRRAGIIHRDVTPRNVLIDEEGAVRLIDFGIAAPVLAQGRAEVFGSPGHMPPEQLAGLPLSPAADVFAVAALLFEAWTGRPVFRRSSARASADATAEGAPPLDEQRPELAPVAALLASGLALDAKQRPPAAEAFARPLRDFLRAVDSGDIARRLGARVLRAKRGPSTRPPGSADSQRTGAISSARDSRPGSEPTATRTFAAREEVQEWTRRLQSERPPAPSDSDSELQAPAEAMQATPALKHADGDVPAELSTRPVSLSSSPPVADDNQKAEVIQAVPAPSAPAPRKPRTLWLALSGLLLVAGASSGWLRVATLKPMQELSAAALPQTLPVRAANTTTPRAPELALTAELAAEASSARSNPTPNLRSASTARARALHPPNANAPSPSASAARTQDNADVTAGRLRLTADPPASVSVQGPNGTRAYTTPVHALSLPSGSYVITFVSATYGAPLVARISVASGQARSVHADFRELEPRLSVE